MNITHFNFWIFYLVSNFRIIISMELENNYNLVYKNVTAKI